MNVTLLYFDGCPNWQLTHERLREALTEAGSPDVVVNLRTVSTPEQAQIEGFRGSPTVLLNAVDPFADANGPVGLACRVFQTPDGLQGAPTVGQLVRALLSARE